MSLQIGIAAIDANQHWFWSLLVTQQEWATYGWDTHGALPSKGVDAWIALVPRCGAHDSATAEEYCAWLRQLSVPTLLLGTPLDVAQVACPLLRVPHLLTTHAEAIAALDVLLPLVATLPLRQEPAGMSWEWQLAEELACTTRI
jgi:hypothetical protein